MKASFWERLLTAPEYRLLRHLLLVATIVLVAFWEIKDIYMEGSRWFPVVTSSVITLLVIYLNIYVLEPQFLVKRRWYWVYLLTVLYVALLVYLVEIRLNDIVYIEYTSKIRELYGKIDINPLLQVFTSIFSLVILMISSSVIVLFRKWAMHDARVNDLEKAMTQMELEQLKKQVNPQFLVRMLDRVNTLSVQNNSEKAAAILLQLGNVLRYQLYDSARKHVLLGSDVRFLTEILSLEQTCRNDFSFTVESDGNLQNYLIPPMLFLPVVEQVVSTNKDVSFINLDFKKDDDTLVFECQSSGITGKTTETEYGGFDNVCHRLSILYKNAYSFKIKNVNGSQIISIHIPCGLFGIYSLLFCILLFFYS